MSHTMLPLTPSDPRRLGRYLLAGRLGAGGQGVVYEGYGEAGERVAVKVPRYDGADSRDRLAREAAAARRVASFCTAKVIEAQVEAAPLYIVSEFVPGPSLKRAVAASGPYGPDALRRLAIGVATALTAIHRAGIVHRDLKPDNIIIGPDGPRVIDFGVAREVGPTTGGPLVGTPGYIPPEVFQGRGASEAADLWAWGMVVLFAARGEDVIAAADPAALVGLVLGFEPDVRDLPGPLGPLVAAALARDPAARPSARQVLLRLLGDPGGDDSGAGDGGDDLLVRGGTLAGALTARPEPGLGAIAEELYGELTEAERAVVPEVFLRMIDGDELRPVARDELPETRAVDSMLTVFGAAGLVTATGTADDGTADDTADGRVGGRVGGTVYELAAPGLLHAWPRLREWVRGNREGLPVHRRLADAAALWEANGRRPADLLHGSALEATLQWAATARRDLSLGRRERAFLDAAAAQARRRARTRRLVAAALAVLLVAALGGLGAAEYLRRETGRQRDDALARELALRAADLRESEPRVAMLLSVASWRLNPAPAETRGALHDSLSQDTTAVFLDPGYAAGTVQALSGDGRALVSVTGGTATIWDVLTRRRTAVLPGVGADVRQAALSPDGRTLALLTDAEARLWDVRAGEPVGAPVPRRGEQSAGELGFDATGRRLGVPWGNRELCEWWDLATRERLTTPSGAPLNAVTRDGRHGYVAAGRDAGLWDLRRGTRTPIPPLKPAGVVEQAAFSDDGRALVSTELLEASGKHRLRVFDVPSGTEVFDEEGDVGGEAAFVFGDAFVAAWGDPGPLLLRRRSSFGGVYQRALPEITGRLRFDLAGRAVRYLDGRGAVRTEDVSMVFDQPMNSGTEGGDVRLDPSARVLAAIWDDWIEVRDAATGRALMKPLSWSGSSGATAFSADGRLLALAADDTVTVTVLEPAGPRVTATLRLGGGRPRSQAGDQATARLRAAAGGGGPGVVAMAFSPDGRTLAVSRYEEQDSAPRDNGGQALVELWDLARGTLRAAAGTSANDLAFRPDGRLLVTVDPFQLVDPAAGVTRPPAPGTGQLGGAFAFSPDGRQAAFSGPDRLTLWDGDITTKLAEFPVVAGQEVSMLAWSPDGRLIATYEQGGRVRLWDVPGRRPLGVVFDARQPVNGTDTGWVAFSADGATLRSVAQDGTIRVHDVAERRVAAAVCARAGRPLSAAEWARYLPGVEPFTVCP
ncbi:WD40 repeat domain-containing serine/threonine-protein kinase [Actinomadura sp. ATCC 31491]|uniref:WD40 repeat domain-containing serine/threonine-protein kinase n=1 Tax=Actinomadura luzonensis TaxID=2805427 RepID=A0ABT0FZG8_9ACTN|nr:WD40 repeat domain-containing serine/threonine-protein kinase [Actinomadura luzonensis]MCK2217746.1 WD40 repeat domain-containing serine/threonine-protein kinase [Actinomadura luzonensis]